MSYYDDNVNIATKKNQTNNKTTKIEHKINLLSKSIKKINFKTAFFHSILIFSAIFSRIEVGDGE